MWSLSHTNKQILSPEVKNWTDLAPKDLLKRNAITISLIIGSIILAAGIAISIYFCCTTYSTYQDRYVDIKIVDDNKILSCYPGIIGGFILIIMISVAVGNHFFFWKKANTHSKIPDQLKMSLMSTLTLEGVHLAYYCRLKALLLHDIISYPEALEMKTILQEYQAISDVKKRYDRLSDNEKQEVENQWNDTYTPMLLTLADLRQRWQAFHERKFPPQ